MPSPHALAGSLLQHTDSTWKPLEQLVGPELCEWFMWMHAVRLADGRDIHAYKHVATRRYFHLALDGASFLYVAGEYVPVAPAHAVGEALRGWEKLRPRPGDLERVRAALTRAASRVP